MQYDVNFGRLAKAPRPISPGTKFRLALLGDFSGRANAGKLDTGEKLAAHKPIKIDVDNLDDVIARMKLSLTLALAEDGSTITVPINSMDDFHPDQLVENVELFESLVDVRRNLGSKATFDRAAREVLSWSGEEPLPPPPREARGTAIATDRRLSDFARLTGRATATDGAGTEIDELVKRLVGPFIQPERDARQEQLTARVDEALSVSMRRVLHHPDFQTAEALWRGVEFLVRRIETDDRSEIVLYDVSAEEFAADLAAGDSLSNCGLYGMLAEQPAMDAHQGPLSAVIGLYGFELTPPHADLLGRAAQVAAAAGAPFIASIAPDALKMPFRDQHPLIKDAWSALYGLPASAYLGLATPRFLLRAPYGKKSDPIDAFNLEEFTRQEGLAGMLWGHPGLLAGLMLAETWAQQGKAMKLGTVMTARDMPYHIYFDDDGDPVPLPCTERLFSERQAAMVTGYRMMPTLTLRGRPEVRLGGFSSVAGTPLAGFWAPVEITPSAEPEPAAPRPAAAEPAAEAPAAAEETPDLDALLASLDTPAAEAPAAEAAAEPAAEAAMDDLDALLASLNAEPEPTAPDATEPDLDALLASLK
ncbi:MAG TPA: type VI secretion system contractile sheath large subunit [Stellaceae bacterium]|nr:type VI secretion system contractile sheath large subunit [Stellaceae bacterium]